MRLQPPHRPRLLDDELIARTHSNLGSGVALPRAMGGSQPVLEVPLICCKMPRAV
jgi:hypothetical protein